MIVKCCWECGRDVYIDDDKYVPGSSYICRYCSEKVRRENVEIMSSHTKTMLESQPSAKP